MGSASLSVSQIWSHLEKRSGGKSDVKGLVNASTKAKHGSSKLASADTDKDDSIISRVQKLNTAAKKEEKKLPPSGRSADPVGNAVSDS